MTLCVILRHLLFTFSSLVWCKYFPTNQTECVSKETFARHCVIIIVTSVLQDIDRLDHYGQLTGLKASQDVTYDSQVSLSLVKLSYLQGLSLVRASTTSTPRPSSAQTLRRTQSSCSTACLPRRRVTRSTERAECTGETKNTDIDIIKMSCFYIFSLLQVHI